MLRATRATRVASRRQRLNGLYIGGLHLLGRPGTYAGAVVLDSGVQRAIAVGGGNYTVSGVIAGDGLLSKVGPETLTLTGTNTYAGGTQVNGGTLAVGQGGTLGTGAVAVNGAALTIAYTQAANTNLSAIVPNVGGISGTGKVTVGSSGLFTVDRNISGSDITINGSSATQSVGGLILNGVTLTATGMVTLDGVTTRADTSPYEFRGNVVINAALLVLGNGGALNQVWGNNGSLTLNLSNNSSTISNVLALGGAGSLVKGGLGTLILTGVNTYTGGTTVNGGGTLVFSGVRLPVGTCTVNSPGTLEINVASGNVGQLNGANVTIAGNGTFAKSGAGTYTLYGSAATFTFAMAGGLINLRAGAMASSSYGLRFAGTNKASLNVATGAGFYWDGGQAGNVTVDGLSGGGVMPSPYQAAALVVGVNNGSGLFSGVIGNAGGGGGGGGGQWSLVKNGTGTQTLTGANTYAGGTIINGGVLKAGSAAAFGAGSITVNAGATLNRNGFALPNAIINNGGTILP